MATAEIRLHGKRVGVLTHRSTLGDATECRLDSSYIDDPARPVLGQRFEEDPRRVWRTTHRVPAWFSNLLPEGPLRELLATHALVHPERELHLLCALGEDLSGAVAITPLDDGELESGPTRPPRPPVDDDEVLRFSLAGMQLKFPLDRGERGLTVPVRGQGGRWIAKMPDSRFERVPENEAAMLSWAAASGIEVPEHHLVRAGDIQRLPIELGALADQQALIIRRFDRTDSGDAIHMEDFAQIRGVFPEQKYEQANYEGIGRILLGLCGPAAVERYVRRLTFMVLTGNADMHLKNWSLCYPDRRTPQLSPAYDLVSTRAYPSTSMTMALKLAKTKRFEEIDGQAFQRLGEKLGLDPHCVRGWFDEARTHARERMPPYLDALPSAQRRALERHVARLRI